MTNLQSIMFHYKVLNIVTAGIRIDWKDTTYKEKKQNGTI